MNKNRKQKFGVKLRFEIAKVTRKKNTEKHSNKNIHACVLFKRFDRIEETLDATPNVYIQYRKRCIRQQICMTWRSIAHVFTVTHYIRSTSNIRYVIASTYIWFRLMLDVFVYHRKFIRVSSL